MKTKGKTLVVCIVIPLLVGAVAGFLTKDSMQIFQTINKPPLSPPAWLFPVIWSVLYVLMGISSYLIVTSNYREIDIDSAIKIYGIQLFVNFLWPFAFFTFSAYLFSFLWLILLLILVIIMMIRFSKISKVSAYLNIPYVLWLLFASYLNLGVYLLN